MIRNVLVGCRALVAIVVLVTFAGACGGGEQDVPERERGQAELLFATDPFGLESGLAIVRMTHQGEGSFVVNLLSATQEGTGRTPGTIGFSEDDGSRTEVASALADESGPVSISRAVNIPAAGRHLFDVKANGPWTIEVDQPRPSSAPMKTSFSGNDNVATPFFWLSKGPKEVTITNPLQRNLVVSLLDKDGNEVEPILVNKTDQAAPDAGQAGQYPQHRVSTTINIDEDGIYLFNVLADNLWNIEITDIEQPAAIGQDSPAEQDANAFFLSSGTLLILLINLVWGLVFAVALRLNML